MKAGWWFRQEQTVWRVTPTAVATMASGLPVDRRVMAVSWRGDKRRYFEFPPSLCEGKSGAAPGRGVSGFVGFSRVLGGMGNLAGDS